MEIQISEFLRCVIEGSSNGAIPDWLLFELLLRLPPYFVYSHLIVSKQWFSLASNRHFVKSYISRASTLPRPWTVLDEIGYTGSNARMPLDLYLEPRLCKPHLPRDPMPPRTEANGLCALLGVSHGLVLYACLAHFQARNRIASFSFYIGNPITGHCIALGGARSFKFRGSGWGFLTRVDEQGILRGYCVVRPLQSRSEDGGAVVNFHVYFSELGEWMEFAVPYPSLVASRRDYAICPAPAATLDDGILYWAVQHLGVIAYDPYNDPENMRLFELPREAWNCSSITSSCSACRGKLRFYIGSFVDEDGFPCFSVWTLDDYNSGEWHLERRIMNVEIPFDLLGSSWAELRPVFCDPFDEDVVYLKFMVKFPNRRVGYIASYDLNTGVLVDRGEMVVRDGPFGLAHLLCDWAFLFVAPPWPTLVADHHLEKTRDG